jgi:DNA-binding NarL/FixJ family response regulator
MNTTATAIQTEPTQRDFVPSDESPFAAPAQADRLVSFLERFSREEGLSRREAQVLAFAVNGSSMKETAAALGLSHKTVEDYWSRLYVKTKRRSQLKVIAKAMRELANSM